MKKLTAFLISGVLLFGAVACGTDTAKTSSEAPSSTEKAASSPSSDSTKATQEDAQSETRRRQANADIKAREERNNALNSSSANRSDNDVASEVRSKLEVNIPNGQLVVKSEKGTVTVSGTVPKQDQLAKIEPLAKEIKGVKAVSNKATVAAPK